MDRYLSPPPTSSVAVCVWIPLFALRCEEARRPALASQPSALLAPDASRRVVWQVSPLARHAGVRPGMTVSQAIGLCPALRLCEPDPVHYDERFALLLAALARVSPVVEPAELGLAYVGMDGLEGIYGRPEGQVRETQLRIADCRLRIGTASVESAIHNPQSAIRLGWGKGKFVAWVAATRAKPGCAIIVHAGEEGKFLAAQPVAVLPLDPDAHRRLRQLGLRTLGRLAALPEEAIVSQFGRAGRRWWRLAAGATAEPVVGRGLPEPISVSLTFFTPVADREMLVLALERLIERALRHPRRTGGACRRCARGPSSSAPPRGSPRPRSRTPPRTATTSPRRSRRAWRRRRPRAPWSGSSSSSPPSPRAPPSCSSSPGTRAPPRGPANGAPCEAPSRRSRSGSNAPCCITSSRSSHGPVFRNAATR